MVAQAIAPYLNVRFKGRKAFRYNALFGIYEPLADDDLVTFVYDYARPAIQASGKPTFAREVIRFLHDDSRFRVFPNPRPPVLAFKNGLLNLADRKLLLHSPEYFLTFAVNANWTSNARCPIFENFLISVCGDDCDLKKRIWEVIGCILVADPSAKSIFLFEGPSNTGKTKLENLIEFLLYPDSVSPSFTADQMISRFAVQRLEDAILCIVPDMPAEPIPKRAVSLMKQLSGGDRVPGEVKYKDWIHFTYGGKLLLVTNSDITLEEEDDAFDQRLVRIPFRESVPRYRQDPLLLEKFKSEADVIASKAIDAYLDLIRQPGWSFSGNYEHPCSVKDAKVDYYDLCITAFKQKNMMESPGKYIFVEDAWIKWKEETGLELSLESFSKRLRKIIGCPPPKRKRHSGRKDENPQAVIMDYTWVSLEVNNAY